MLGWDEPIPDKTNWQDCLLELHMHTRTIMATHGGYWAQKSVDPLDLRTVSLNLLSGLHMRFVRPIMPLIFC